MRTLRRVTTEGIALTDAAAQGADEAALRCYRHPERETYISCGRCERPICTRCAMQGPVGFRCRQCGKPSFDPLTSLTPGQLAVGGGIALAGGVVSGLAGAVGFFGLCAALFIGGAAAEAIRRTVGYKQGPMVSVLVFGGLLLGAVVGYSMISSGTLLPLAAAGVDSATLGTLFGEMAGWAVLIGAVACFGAHTRLR